MKHFVENKNDFLQVNTQLSLSLTLNGSTSKLNKLSFSFTTEPFFCFTKKLRFSKTSGTLNRQCKTDLYLTVNNKRSFATVGYNIHVRIKPDYAVFCVFNTMTNFDLRTLPTICEIEKETKLRPIYKCQLKLYNLLETKKKHLLLKILEYTPERVEPFLFQK